MTEPTRRKPWMKFYPADWRAHVGLRQCSPTARGIWIELISLMHASPVYGHLLIAGRAPTEQQIAVQIGCETRDVKSGIRELEEWRVLRRTSDGVIFSGRMIRDAVKDEQNLSDGLGGGNPEIRRGTVPKSERKRRFRPSDNPTKTARILAKSDGCCHWCGVMLQRDHAGKDFYHVDHLVAICDGGGNEDDNLVAACAECNHKRARNTPSDPNGGHPSDHKVGSGSDLNGGHPSDPKAQKPEARLKNLEKERKEDSPKPPAIGGRSKACRENPEFALFYANYPRKDAPDDALKAWKALIAAGVNPDDILDGLSRYAFPSNPQYIRMPAGWLRGGCWRAVTDNRDPVLVAAGYDFDTIDRTDDDPLANLQRPERLT